MKKTIIPLLIIFFVFSSCAAVKQPIDQEYWGFHKVEKVMPEELYSDDDAVRSNAAAVFDTLPDSSKEQVMTYLAYTLSDEQDPVVRAKTFSALTEYKAGAYVVAPLLEAAKENKSALILREVKAFASRFKPSEFELKPMVKFLKDENWSVKLTAAKIIGLMSKRAETALPEIFEAMHSAGERHERYVDMYNAASMINPRIAILQVIVDMQSADNTINRNAINKLFELYMFLSKDSNIRKEILPALVRLMYSEDETLSKTSRELVSSLGDAESEKALKAYMAMGKLAFAGMADMAGQKLQDKFKRQQEDALDEIAVFYKLIGRADAVADIKK